MDPLQIGGGRVALALVGHLLAPNVGARQARIGQLVGTHSARRRAAAPTAHGQRQVVPRLPRRRRRQAAAALGDARGLGLGLRRVNVARRRRRSSRAALVAGNEMDGLVVGGAALRGAQYVATRKIVARAHVELRAAHEVAATFGPAGGQCHGCGGQKGRK